MLRSINDIQQFVELINFYRRFIRNFSRIATSLTSMLKNFEEAYRKSKSRKRKRSRSRSLQRSAKFLTLEFLEAFETLKICFIEMSLLHHFNFICRFRVEIDASDKTIEDVLIQLIDDE